MGEEMANRLMPGAGTATAAPLSDALDAYVPMDRRQAMARGERLPDLTLGAALSVEIAGFATLAETLDREYGPAGGAEQLISYLNQILRAVAAEVHRYQGSIMSFSGHALTCWFDAGAGGAAYATRQPVEWFDEDVAVEVATRAVTCAFAVQAAVRRLDEIVIGAEVRLRLGVKIAVASGPARRVQVGDPSLQVLDTITGATVARLATGAQLVLADEVLVDAATFALLGPNAVPDEWRDAQGQRFTVLMELPAPAVPAPWPALAGG
jgi:class 3 adenylate cyclase